MARMALTLQWLRPAAKRARRAVSLQDREQSAGLSFTRRFSRYGRPVRRGGRQAPT